MITSLLLIYLKTVSKLRIILVKGTLAYVLKGSEETRPWALPMPASLRALHVDFK